MGILNNTVSICQFQVLGAFPATDLADWVGEGLTRDGFRSIEQTSVELSTGWVQLDDYQESGFEGLHTFQHDHYFAFSLRRDQRKLPTALVKPYFVKAEQEWLTANPQFKRVPKQQREDLRDAGLTRLDTPELVEESIAGLNQGERNASQGSWPRLCQVHQALRHRRQGDR